MTIANALEPPTQPERPRAEPWDPFSPWPAGRRWLWLLWAIGMVYSQGPAFYGYLHSAPQAIVDFFEDWASAKNFLGGLPVYTSHKLTAERYLGHPMESSNTTLVDLNWHPPPSVLLALPFAGLSYPKAIFVWNLLSLAALGVSIGLIVRGLGLPFSLWALCPLTVLLLACSPLAEQFFFGQSNLLLLLLLTGVWLAQRAGRLVGAGLLLGTATVIKLFPGFLLVYFVLRRQWKAVAATAVTFVGLTAGTAAVLGPQTYRTYIQEVLPSVASGRSAWSNASLAGFWSKLFDPASEPDLPWPRTQPLWPSPALARAGTLLSCAGVVVALVWVCRRAQTRAERDHAFGVAVIAMLLVSPITWSHYFLLLFLPLPMVWLALPRSGGARILFLGILLALWQYPALVFALLIPGGYPSGVATPVYSVTVLSFQCYALLALLLLSLAEAKRRNRFESLTA